MRSPPTAHFILPSCYPLPLLKLALYLRIVHTYDVFNALDSPVEDHMEKRCATIHVRATSEAALPAGRVLTRQELWRERALQRAQQEQQAAAAEADGGLRCSSLAAVLCFG